MNLFDQLGFTWDRSIITENNSFPSKNAVFRFKRMLPQFVFDASALEGNPFTYPEVKTLMDGVTVGGHKLSDEQQVLNLVAAANTLFTLVKDEQFIVNKPIFDRLHVLVAKEEALEWGNFRGEGAETDYTPFVSLGEHEPYHPLPTIAGAAKLNRVFSQGVEAMNEKIDNQLEYGLVFFLFGALQQFYFDGNKRTSRFMMNGILMTHGLDAISIPARSAKSFNEKMVRFFLGRNATEMMDFLVKCRPKDNPKPETGIFLQ